MGKDFTAKALVGQPLRRDEQNIDIVVLHGSFDTAPSLRVVRVDRLGTHTHALGCGYLVAHQGEQRRNEQDRSLTRLAQQPGGDEVDEALAPAGLLHHEIPARLFDNGADGLFLSNAELRVRHTGPDSQQFQRTFMRIRDHALSSVLDSESVSAALSLWSMASRSSMPSNSSGRTSVSSSGTGTSRTSSLPVTTSAMRRVRYSRRRSISRWAASMALSTDRPALSSSFKIAICSNNGGSGSGRSKILSLVMWSRIDPLHSTRSSSWYNVTLLINSAR